MSIKNADIAFIQQFKTDIEKYLEKNDNNEIEELNNEIEEIIEQYEFNKIDAINSWNSLMCSNFTNFQDYLNYIDPDCLRNTNTVISRVKITRAERKKPICIKCNKELTAIDSELICTQCGYSENIKTSTPNTRINNINSKHVIKQMEAICGIKKIPAKIEKLREYILVWLTDLHFIYDWLIYSNNMENFINKYERYTTYKIENTEKFFNRIIERIPENKIKFKVFKLFMDEFYLLLEFCKKRYSSQISNLSCESDEVKLKVIKSYLETNSNIPEPKDVFIYNNNIYEIGLYFAELSIWYTHSAQSIFNKIVKLFNSKNNTINEKSFTVPGLMFNFPEVYKTSENVPKKYSYGQEYIYLNNYVFNVPYINISNQDKKEIEEIIFEFNKYYKDENSKRLMSNKVNSPLFTCTIVCIIEQLPKFNKYKIILDYLPDKALINSTTKSYINAIWFKFIIENPQILEKYKEEKQEEEMDNLFIL